jgi:uncharacterized spore protein YtfJ
MLMKDFLSDAVAKKISQTLESTGGARALFGEPVTLDGMEVVPVARVSIVLGASADGSGGGNAGASGRLKGLAKGSGGGQADASVRIDIEPMGYLTGSADGPAFHHLD